MEKIKAMGHHKQSTRTGQLKKNKKQEYIKDTVNQIKWWYLLFHSAGILGLCQLKSVGIC